MDNIDQNFENDFMTFEKRKAKEPFRVSLSVCILCILLACLFVFMTTYVAFSLHAERMVNKAYERVSEFEKLIEVVDIFEDQYYYDVDFESIEK